MKKAFKIILGILLLLLVLIIAFPYLYKDKIEAYIKEEINKSVNAEVDYKDVNLSLIKDFPYLHVSINDISVKGVGIFDSIKLANIGELDMSLNFKKLFTDENLEIKKIGLKNSYFNILVLKDGKANYDITKKNEKNDNSKDKSFDLKINKINADNLNLNYNDKSMGLFINVKNFTQTGNGKFKQDNYSYNLKGKADTLNVIFDNIHYVNNAKTSISSDIKIENNFKTYTFNDVKANINDLDLISKMKFILKDNDDIDINIEYQTKSNSLKKFLSLIPKTYMPDLHNITTSGSAVLKGFVKGTYNKNNYPSYDVDFKINKGIIKYPDLPESIKNINLTTKVSFKGGNNLDQTIIDIPYIAFSVANNDMNGKLNIKNPITDPLINTRFKGKIDFDKINNALKLSKSGIKNIKGLLDTDIHFKSRVSAVEKEKYKNVEASGNFKLSNFTIETDSIPYPVKISNADVKITPENLKITELKSKVGKSDFEITGNLSNYLTHIFNKDKTITANFKIHSHKVNINEFMRGENNNNKDTSTYIKVPKNIEIKLATKIDEVIYKDITLNNLSGNLTVKDEKINLNTVLSKTFDGEMILNGVYDTSKEKPVSGIKMNLKRVSIPKATDKLTTFSYYTPFLKKVDGNFFSNMDMDVQLDNKMNLILSTMNLKGMLETKNIQLSGMKILTEISNLLKMKFLNKANIDKIKAQFIIKKGNLLIKPFGFKLNGMKSEMSGKVSLDKKMDFILKMDIPKNKLGGNANKILENLFGNLSKFGIKAKLPETIKMSFKIKGDYNNPKIIPVISGYEGESVKEVVTQVITEKVEEAVNDAKEKAISAAKAKADELLKQAKIQSDNLIKEAEKLGNQLKKEAKIQSNNLIKEAGDNIFKKFAAQKAAKEINRQADLKSAKLIAEAKNKATLILKKAKEKGDKLVEEAKNK